VPTAQERTIALWLKALGGVPPSEEGRQSIVTLHHRVAHVIRPNLDRRKFMRVMLDEWPDAVGTVEALHRKEHRHVPAHVRRRLHRPHPGYVVRHLADFLDWYDDRIALADKTARAAAHTAEHREAEIDAVIARVQREAAEAKERQRREREPMMAHRRELYRRALAGGWGGDRQTTDFEEFAKIADDGTWGKIEYCVSLMDQYSCETVDEAFAADKAEIDRRWAASS
jgi:hypothetical protein